MTALQELAMQGLVDRRLLLKATMPTQAIAKPSKLRGARKPRTATLAAQSSGLTSSVELGPAEEQASSSSQEQISTIDQVDIQSQVKLLHACQSF